MRTHADRDGSGRRNPIAWVASTLHTIWYAREFWTSPVNRYVVDQVDPGPFERVADVGAGLGPAVVEAAPRMPGGVVIAVEPAAYMRTVLGVRRRWQRSRERIDVRSGTAEQLPVGDDELNAIWAVNAMHHFADLEAVAREASRALEPGGRLVFVDEDFESEDHALGGSGHGDDGHLLSAEEIDALVGFLSRVGFVDVSAERSSVDGVPIIAVRAIAGAAGSQSG
jgi:SAM-dependent methyltransferase